MNEYWIVKDRITGKAIANCGDINDAIMLVSFDPDRRTYVRHRVLLDQVVDVISTTDKQLPGQIGLPPSNLNELKEYKDKLPEGTQIPIDI